MAQAIIFGQWGSDDMKINNIFPIGSVYLTLGDINPSTFLGGTWEQIFSTLATSKNVVGNGYSIGITQGTSLTTGILGSNVLSDGYNKISFHKGDVGSLASTSNGANYSSGGTIGIQTKDLLGDNLEYSGMEIADSLTIYGWKRTA